MKTINKQQVIKLLMNEMKITKKQAKAFIDELMLLIKNVPISKYTLSVPYIGIFTPKRVAPQACYNFKTKSRMIAPPRLKTSFNSTRYIRELIKGMACDN